MSIFSDWGFTQQGWRTGQHGEYWVVAQAGLLMGFLLLPIYRVSTAGVPFLLMMGLLVVAIVLTLMGLLLVVRSVWDLQQSLTPLPYPRQDAELIRSGVYGILRHPIYSGVIWAAIGWAIYQLSVTHLIGAIVLLLFLNAKADREERWLVEKFPEYREYQQQVGKLLPGVGLVRQVTDQEPNSNA